MRVGAVKVESTWGGAHVAAQAVLRTCTRMYDCWQLRASVGDRLRIAWVQSVLRKFMLDWESFAVNVHIWLIACTCQVFPPRVQGEACKLRCGEGTFYKGDTGRTRDHRGAALELSSLIGLCQA